MPVRGPLLAILVSVIAFVAPVGAAQLDDQPAQVAPAIGPWLSVARGSIASVEAIDGGVQLTGSARDADSAAAISYEIVVDGLTAASGATPRPDGFGESVGFSETVVLADGLHEVCLRLIDPRLGGRTVDCTTATTAPPNTVTAVARRKATGALITTSGVVVPVQGGGPGNWQVTSPCGVDLTLETGTFIPRARVVIDPGHGGSESGAVGQGVLEKHLNLDVSELVQEKLEALGISAVLTRNSDYRLPIGTRAGIANALAPDVFISVHHNGGAVRPSSRPGTEVFYSTAVPGSQRLAAVMYEEMVDALSPFDVAWVSTVSEGASVRLREDGMDLYGVHRFSPDITSLITEFVYLSNPPEAALMQRDGMIEIEAQAIVDGLLRWWWTDDAGTSLGREFTDSSSSGTGGFDGCTDPTLNIEDNLALGIGRPEFLAEQAIQMAMLEPPTQLLPALFLGTDPAVSQP
jgi:N-acetylmuramoyl-L-alanine amidase